MNIGFVLQALHHRLERTVKSQVEVMEQLEKMKDENDDLKFQVCACLNCLIIFKNAFPIFLIYFILRKM
jgi:uncharacterized membrane-anchored protein YhcB (DUF1043 family)